MLNEKLLQKISKREKIQVTSGTHEYVCLALLSAYILGSAAMLFYMTVWTGFGWKWIGAAFLLSVAFVPLYKLCFKLADLAIKGDVVLINQLFKPCRVTSIKSVREIRTRKFLNCSLTSMTYYLDGSRRRIILFTRANSDQEPETILRTVRKAA